LLFKPNTFKITLFIFLKIVYNKCNILLWGDSMKDGKYLSDAQEKKVINKEKESVTKLVMAYLHDLVFLLGIILVLFLICFRVVVVSGPSMKSTLLDGDYLLLVGRSLYSEPKRGDIIVASKDSFDQGTPIIKRVIATEGQVVDIDFTTGTVTVGDDVLEESYINTSTTLNLGTEFPLTVAEGCVFVMGDNRNNSTDSRSPEIGQIDCREIIGKAIILFLPGTDNGSVERDFSRIGVLF